MAWQEILAEINQCNKCGFCLPTCPTYQITGNELASPRGRIAMVEALARGEVTVGAGLEEALTYCLDCRACETACPSGVPYHRILEVGRNQLWQNRPATRKAPWLVRQALGTVTRPRRLARFSRWARRGRHLPLPAALRQFLPMLGPESPVPPAPDVIPHATASAQFFSGCMMSAVFPEANHAAQHLLALAAVEVKTPPAQTCCGALHWHAGDAERARQLARQNIAAFAGTTDPVVNTAGGCGAMLREYGDLFADDPVWAERARQFSARIRDWATLFLRYGQEVPLVGDGERVTLQNSCHLVNVEKAGDDAVAVLQRVAQDTFVPLASQNRCCGSAGTYNVVHTDWALKILDQKMAEVEEEAPDRIL
ncbi:MAG: (Fe-S)-binding protein, partial [Sulfobacillus benefaciens]